MDPGSPQQARARLPGDGRTSAPADGGAAEREVAILEDRVRRLAHALAARDSAGDATNITRFTELVVLRDMVVAADAAVVRSTADASRDGSELSLAVRARRFTALARRAALADALASFLRAVADAVAANPARPAAIRSFAERVAADRPTAHFPPMLNVGGAESRLPPQFFELIRLLD